MADAILAIQIITWIIAGIALFMFLTDGRWLAMILPAALFISLFLFLTERIVFKLDLFPLAYLADEPGSFVNAWAVGIQFQVALSAVVALGVLYYSRRANGDHGQSESD